MEKIETLTDNEILDFYKKVVLRFEYIKNPFKEEGKVHQHQHSAVSLISLDATNQLIETFGINIQNVKLEDIPEDVTENKVQQFVNTSKCVDKNEATYTYYTLFTHLRNSFTHNLIKKEGDCYLFKDIRDDGKVTMIARIKKDQFFGYIDAIYEESKKYATAKQWSILKPKT